MSFVAKSPASTTQVLPARCAYPAEDMRDHSKYTSTDLPRGALHQMLR